MTLARNATVAAVGNILPPILALATQPLLAQSLGVSGRGEVAAATAPLMLATVVLGFGIPEALTFSVARRMGNIRRILPTALVALALAGAAGSIAIWLLASQLSGGNSSLASIIALAGLGIAPGLIVSGLRGIAAGSERWLLISIERISGAALRLVLVGILCVTSSLTVTSATVIIVSTTFAGGVVYLMLLRPRVRVPPNTDARSLAPSFTVFAIQVWVGAAAGMLYSRLDQLLMTPLSGVYQLGLYSVAASIAEVVVLANLAVRDVVFSAESARSTGSRSIQASRISTLITLALSIGVASVSPWLVPLFFGEDFGAAVGVIFILLAAAVIGNPGSVAGAILSGRGRPGLRSVSLLAGLVVNVVFIFLLVPPLGAIGAAIATLVASTVAGNNLNVLWLRVYFKIPLLLFFIPQKDDFRIAASLWQRFISVRTRRIEEIATPSASDKD